MTYTFFEEFAGAGGFTQGVDAVDGVGPTAAANHDPICLASHRENYPEVRHYGGDIRELDMSDLPACDLFHASPCCPPFTNARGETQYFDADTQTMLFEDEYGVEGVSPEVRRGRLLMHQVPRYLEAMSLRGRPVIAGTVENVVEARKWGAWHRWIGRIKNTPPGYDVAVIAINSMHLMPARTRRPPQSRDRLLVMYWQKGIGRRPDLDKWMLRPRAWCTGCDEQVAAMQVFKKRDCDMGRYGRYGQYYYRCPNRKCGGRIVEPEVLGAIEAIDWTLPAVRIGDRVDSKGRPDPLEPTTIARIEAGIAKHWGPLLVPSGGTWRTDATPASVPMPSRTTRETDALTVPPSAAGRSPAVWDLLVPYYRNGNAQPLTDPMGALTTRDRYALAAGDRYPADVNDFFYRMLAVPEIGRGMGYADGYIVLGNVKQRVRQYGQSCTPCLGELSYSAIVEAVSGESIGDDPWSGYRAQRLAPVSGISGPCRDGELFTAAELGLSR